MASDADGDALTYSASGLPSGASFNATTRTFSWTPAASQSGLYTDITFRVSDGILSDQESINITVMPASSASSSLSFDGTDDRVVVASSSSLNITEPFSIELWMYPQKLNAYQYLVDRRSGGSSNNFFVALWNNNQIRFSCYGLSNTTVYSARTFSSADLNKWWQIVCIYDGSQMQIYINGQKDATANAVGTPSAITAPLSIGANYGGAFPYQGRIDEVRISNRARSVAEINYAYNEGAGQLLAADADTLALWHMNEGSGSIIQDVKGINNGTVSGAIWSTGITSIPSLRWDINGDGKVNNADMALVQQKMGATGTPGWIKEDINSDGIVSILDMIVIGQNWTG